MDNSSNNSSLSRSSQAGDGGSRPSPRDLKLLGTTLGGCEITDFIGRGGMGSVFKAIHRALNREVAIKVLSKGAEDKKAVDWFLREARAIARLEHRNIIQVYDLSFDDRLETYYIVMQFIPGESLDVILKSTPSGRISLEETLQYVIQASEGLGAAHKMNIVHRDVKPSNLMVTSEGVIKITDFGLAKGLTAEETSVSSGLIVGTPLYMAPEQCVGSDIDGRTDIYALGATMYHLLTGGPPFTGENSYEILEKQITELPVRPENLIPEIPVEISDIIMRMLAKSPQDRYQTCEEVVEELNALLAGPSPARGSSTAATPTETEAEGVRVSGVDRLQLTEALREVVYSGYQGTFTIRTRDAQLFLTVGENELHILQEDVDMAELQEEYSSCSAVELTSMLLIQTLEWEPFSWEFAEEFPDEEFFNLCLSITTDPATFLLGYAGIIQILLNIETPGTLVVATPIDSAGLVYRKEFAKVVAPVPKVGEKPNVLPQEKIAQTIKKICEGNFHLEYRNPYTIRLEEDPENPSLPKNESEKQTGEEFQSPEVEPAELPETEESFSESEVVGPPKDSIAYQYLKTLYQVPDFTFFQHLMPDFETIYAQINIEEIELDQIRALSDEVQQLLIQTFNQSQLLENIGLPKDTALLITGAVLKEKIVYALNQFTELAKITEENGQRSMTELILKEIKTLHPYHVRLLEEIASLNEELNNLDRASELWIRCGQMREDLLALEQAKSCYEHALEIVSGNYAAQLALFYLHLNNSSIEEIKQCGTITLSKLRTVGKTDVVVEVCEDILKVAPDTVYALQELINYHYDQNHLEEAAKLYERLAEVYHQQGNEKLAVQTYRKLQRIMPERQEIEQKIKLIQGKKPLPSVQSMRDLSSVLNYRREQFFLGAAVVLLVLVIAGWFGYHEWSGYRKFQYLEKQAQINYSQVKPQLVELTNEWYLLGYHEKAFDIYLKKESEAMKLKREKSKQRLKQTIEGVIDVFQPNYQKVDYELGLLLEKEENQPSYLQDIIQERRLEIKKLIKKEKVEQNQTLYEQTMAILKKPSSDLDEQDFSQIDKNLEFLVKVDPISWEKKVHQAKELLKEKQSARALYIAQQEENQKQLLEQAQAQEEENKLQRAIATYQQVVDLVSGNSYSDQAQKRISFLKDLLSTAKKWQKQAREHLKDKEYKKAVEEFEKIITHPRLAKSEVGDIRIPVLVSTAPDIGVICTNNGEEIGVSPCLYQYQPGAPLDLGVAEKGFQVLDVVKEQTAKSTVWKATIYLKRIPIWEFKTKGIIESPLKVDPQQRLLYAASRDNSLYAIDTRNGEEVWQFYSGHLSEITGDVQLHDSQVSFSTLGGYFYTLKGTREYLEKNARVQWQTRLSRYIFQAGPSVYGSIAVLGSTDGSVLVLKQKGSHAQPIRKYQLQESVVDQPVIVNKNIYTADSNRIYAYSLVTQKLLWQSTPIRNQNFTSFQYHQGKFYLGSNPGGLYVYDLNGNLFWHTAKVFSLATPPVIEGDFIYLSDIRGNLAAYNLNTQQVVWNQKIETSFQVPGLIYQNALFIGGENFTMYALDKRTGQVEWQYSLPKKMFAAPACDGSSLFIPSENMVIAVAIRDLLDRLK